MLALIFVLCVAGIGFTYAGYPLLLALVARLRPRPAQRGLAKGDVCVVIVAYNEADRIAAKLENCLAQDYAGGRVRVLLGSDGSDDQTVTIAQGFRSRGVEVLAFANRRGKAACLNDLLAACDSEFVVFCDVRQTLDPDAVRCLLENFADVQVGAVSGELAFRSDAIEGFGEGMDAYWRYEKFIRNREGLIASTVGVSGALYALRRDLWQPIPESTILDDVLIPMNVVLQGQRVIFDGRAVAWDKPSTQASEEKRRKVRTLAGNFQLFTRHPRLLSPWHNPVFLQTLCHKVLRLLVPALMVLALASNAVLAMHAGHWRILLLAQLAVHALAIAGCLSPSLARIRPVRLLAAFFQLNAFVVLGLFEFLFNRNAHRWR